MFPIKLKNKIMKFNFLNNGVEYSGSIFEKGGCERLVKEIRNSRNFSKIFLTKKDWQNKKFSYIKNNPGPGRNLLNKLETQFIFENKKFKNIMTSVLGKNYRILDSKLVMGFPIHYIPKWILEIKKNHHTVNLGEFIKPKYRDITYFRGIDFHQDIIDFPTRSPDFVTAYIYLEDVDLSSAPLYVIPNSFKLGATTYPHQIDKLAKNKINYSVSLKRNMKCNFKVLVGKQGTLHYWHPFILHGTQPQKKDVSRLSVRLLVEKNRQIDINCDLDKVNKKIKGKMKLDIYNLESKKKSKKNFINKLQ